MIYRMASDGQWFHYIDDLDALVILAAHLHVALFYMQEVCKLEGHVFPSSMKGLAIQTAHVMDCAGDLKKGKG